MTGMASMTKKIFLGTTSIDKIKEKIQADPPDI